MNQGRIWCVVHPTVGLPLLLGSVAITSLIVHASVMSHTTWMSNYWQGASRVKFAPAAAATPVPGASVAAPAGFTFSVAPVTPAPGATQAAFVVTMSANAATGPTSSGPPQATKAAVVTTASVQ